MARIRFSNSAFRQLLNGPEITADITARTEKVLEKANATAKQHSSTGRHRDKYDTHFYHGQTRFRGTVHTKYPHKLSEKTRNELLGALDAGRTGG